MRRRGAPRLGGGCGIDLGEPIRCVAAADPASDASLDVRVPAARVLAFSAMGRAAPGDAIACIWYEE